MTPPMVVPCPPMYLVAECTTMSAPNPKGGQDRISEGVSTIRGMPASGDLRHRFDVEHVDQRVAQGFGVTALVFLVIAPAEVFRIIGVDEGGIDAELRKLTSNSE